MRRLKTSVLLIFGVVFSLGFSPVNACTSLQENRSNRDKSCSCSEQIEALIAKGICGEMREAVRKSKDGWFSNGDPNSCRDSYDEIQAGSKLYVAMTVSGMTTNCKSSGMPTMFGSPIATIIEQINISPFELYCQSDLIEWASCARQQGYAP